METLDQTTLTSRERMLRAIRREPVDRPPVWMMRQAGRYMPEYRAVRERYDFLTMCRTPEAAAEVSLQPLRALGVDAVIVFNDILIPLEAMGLPVEFTEAGPVLTRPLRRRADLDGFRAADFDAEEPVAQTLRLLRREIGEETALLGFVGAPFTMAAYAIEGKMSRNLDAIKAMRFAEPELLQEIARRIAETIVHYARIQVEAGVDVIQLFDTWGGTLSVAGYREFALPHQRWAIERIRALGVPVTLYAKGSAPMLEAMAESGAETLSVDWRLPLSEVRRRVGPEIALQGNLDPAVLLTDPETVRRETRAMLQDAAGMRGHIANLGHGIQPQTPVACAQAFIDTVKESGA